MAQLCKLSQGEARLVRQSVGNASEHYAEPTSEPNEETWQVSAFRSSKPEVVLVRGVNVLWRTGEKVH